MDKDKITQASTATSHSELGKNESSGPSSRLAESMLQNSEKISSGSPSVYKLTTKIELKRRKSMIVRKSIDSPGKKRKRKRKEGRGNEKVLMVVGATGAGKTTLINGMVNFILGVEWKDDFRYKLVIEDSKVSQANSQTKEITSYTFYPMEGSAIPYTFTIIDTPGFGDTEGLERDRKITNQIQEFFSIPPPEGIDHLNGIGFVTQAPMAHLTPTQECIFDSILSIFGKDVVKNIFMLVTFADGQQPPVMKAVEKANIPSQKYFKFNNSALFAENGEETEEIFDAVYWKMGARSFKSLFAEVENSESVSLQLTKEVWEEREKVQTLIGELNNLCAIKKLNEDIQNVDTQISTIKTQIQQSLGRLDEIALKPNPLTQVQNLEQLIGSEKEEAKPGWKKRVQYYEEAKRQAEILSSMKDVGARRLAENILQNSEKVSSGSPSVYKLTTKIGPKRKKSMIVRKSIGSPGNLGRRNEKVLMVVGATGAGKTTLINGMVNFILGVEWKDDFRYKLVIEDSKVSQANSQTKKITSYTFYPMEGSAIPYTFTVIDTPGFGDTEGLERDRKITNQIQEFFSIPPPEGIDHLDGIGFVTQASMARLTPTQEYIFDSILSIFGKDVVENIFMLVTFADGQLPPVMDAIKKAKIPSEKFYKFNNSALFAENTEETDESFDAMFWKMGVRSFKTFFAEFEKSQTVSLQLTQEVLKEREQLQTLIGGLNPQINMGLSKIEEMRQEENVLKQRETEIVTNKSFTYTVDITKPREKNLRGTGQHTTTCLRCNFTCHPSCTRADDREKRLCCVMDSNGNCTVCPQHCYWNEHRNLPYLIEYETVTETRTSDDLKKNYYTAVSGKNKVQGMIRQLQEYLVNMHTKVLNMIVQAQQSLRRLDEIALKPNPLTQVEYLELLIESEKNEAKSGWKKRVKYYEEAKRQAQILSKVKDVKVAEKMIKEKASSASSGDTWYSQFKFW